MIKPLKVAVISDSQAYPTLHDWGMNNLIKAFKVLSPMKPDVLLMAGDLADTTIYETFQLYREQLEKYFDPVPVHVGCAGNHDYWTPKDMVRDPEYIYSRMSRMIGQRDANPLRETVGGYDFIAFSEDIGEDYSPEMLAKLETEIQSSIARDPEKPIFIVTHFHPANTVSGSHGASGKPRLRELFDRYPQIVSLSGHTHRPLEDERCIWQGEFTAINTSTLAYACIGEKCYNNCSVIVPFAREALRAMMLEIYPDHYEIHRYNVEDGSEIKPDRVWSSPIPYTPAKACYTAERKAKRRAPEFPEGAHGVIRYDFGFLYLIFDPAQHDDFTHFYNVKIYEKTDGEYALKREVRYISDFYRIPGIAGRQQVFKLPGEDITPGCECRVEIYPEESFGNIGAPLIVERKLPKTRSFKDSTTTCPQE